MISRRHALAGAAGSLLWAVAHAAPPTLALQGVATPPNVVQISAGGPTGLLALADGGTLWALGVHGEPPKKLADGFDATTPLAIGYGRLAARRRDGGLWVLQGGRVSASAPGVLSPAAGLLNLPLAIVGIAADGRVVRLEPGATGAWAPVATSTVLALPDARPIQADVDGAGDGGHVVVLAGPDSERYPHGVLGDRVEATRLCVLERHSLRTERELVVSAPYVLEDIAPRKVALGSRDGLLTVRSGSQGAQLVLVDADPAAAGALRMAASGPPLGTANRWLSPTTNGQHWLAVHTPHLGGVLHDYVRDGMRLVPRRVLDGISNHRIGTRLLDMAAWQGNRLLMPDQSGRRLLLLDAAAGWQPVAQQSLAARAVAAISLAAPGWVALLQDDGGVVAGRVQA
jgi:hypothetical protein